MAITIGMYINQGAHVSGHTTDVEGFEGIERVILTGSDEARSIADRIDKAEYAEDAWDALVGDDSVPLLMVLTNNRDAGRMNLQAVEAGKYVYGEKPGARTAGEMAQIVQAAQRTGGHFTPCYARRTFPETLEIKRLIEAGAIGELWSFQAAWITSTAQLRGVGSWMFDADLAGGGILYWLACHWVDLMRFVTGRRAIAVSAMVSTCNPHISVEDVACLNLRLEGGAIGTLRAGYLIDPSDGYSDNDLMTSYQGSMGSIEHLPSRPGRVRLRTRAEGFWSLGEVREISMTRTERGYAPLLLRDVVDAAVTRRAPLVTEQDALYVLRVFEAAYESARTGSEVEVNSRE